MPNLKIPNDSFTVINYMQQEMPAVAAINAPLLKLKYKKEFTFCLAIMVEFKSPNEKGMPSKEELAEIDVFEDTIFEKLKGTEATPNTLFLGRITWNGARDLYFRVENPEIAHNYLQTLIKQEDFPIKFDYMMKQDKKYEMTKFLPKLLKGKK